MKVLVSGAAGQLGRELLRQCGMALHDVLGADRSQLDICDKEQVNKIFSQFRPDIVINCAAYNAVDNCEDEECYQTAYQVNVIGAENIAKAAERYGAGMVQLSTDYVFDGDLRSPLDESAVPNPINRYGYTKLMGEHAALTYCRRTQVVRTAWLYGEGKNFARTIQALAKTRPSISVVDDQFGTPTSTVDLARALLGLMRTDEYGVFHATNEGACSWYDFACSIVQKSRLNAEVVRISSKDYGSKARRPAYSVLENHRLKQMGIYFRPWDDALSEYLKLQE